jgi:hypothetical protein
MNEQQHPAPLWCQFCKTDIHWQQQVPMEGLDGVRYVMCVNCGSQLRPVLHPKPQSIS